MGNAQGNGKDFSRQGYSLPWRYSPTLLLLMGMMSNSATVLQACPSAENSCVCQGSQMITCNAVGATNFHFLATGVEMHLCFSLSITYNILSEIPSDIFLNLGLIKLEELVLRNNGISTLQNNSFNGLVNLKHLDLSRNLLSHIHPAAFNSCCNNINILQLSYNSLREIEFLSKLNRLQSFSAAFNNISSLNETTFDNCWQLKSINLSHNEIRNISEGAFQNIIDLSELNLSSNYLTNLNFMESLKNIKYLYVSENRISKIQNEFDLRLCACLLVFPR
ncbi:leucine-rich repeat transmembrane neuronal protein 3 [Anabrus simplex]|uniref:leucine-rich repeat transmembrane neuronal protein 3 n=1 Tax=Anabrus simplex TaxID=316456 RepID=UPI0035A30DEF